MGQNEIDTYKTHSGIRTIKLIQNPEKDGGKSFYFEVNGIAVFAKGSNYIPSDIFPSRVTDKHYEELISAAAEANMNMFRVWGGGIYEYDIALIIRSIRNRFRENLKKTSSVCATIPA